MALVTSRHHLEITRGARLSATQRVRCAVAGGRLTAEGGRGLGGAPALPAPRGLACVGLRSADLARDAALLTPTHPRLSSTLRRHNRVKKLPAYPNER
ncbi:unnamed protein product [Euphydryas editha]|uniref:Uncharacterized protein n=1 Tax=Euphydryas editha TaxID=104508 RepID=A0AAU9TR86_EUPED|nr:unnamed protein product [Euphydryas editha]